MKGKIHRISSFIAKKRNIQWPTILLHPFISQYWRKVETKGGFFAAQTLQLYKCIYIGADTDNRRKGALYSMVAVHNFFYILWPPPLSPSRAFVVVQFSLSESFLLRFSFGQCFTEEGMYLLQYWSSLLLWQLCGKTEDKKAGIIYILCIRLQRFDLFGYKQRWFILERFSSSFFFLFFTASKLTSLWDGSRSLFWFLWQTIFLFFAKRIT